jgi:hypothetical protein
VSTVPDADGFRLLCNRDEQRERATALPPARHRLGAGVAVYPVDPVGGGTWVGVNDAGLTAALLNRTLPGRSPTAVTGLRSRGLIVPCVLACRSVQGAIEACASLDLTTFNPFRLVIVQGKVAATLSSDGRTLTTQSVDSSQPYLVTSSSLGDDLVEEPRAALFERLVLRRYRAGSARRTLDGQTRFHAHRWRARSALSVMMERPDAHTVSRTAIRVSRRGIELRYDRLDGNALRIERLA